MLVLSCHKFTPAKLYSTNVWLKIMYTMQNASNKYMIPSKLKVYKTQKIRTKYISNSNQIVVAFFTFIVVVRIAASLQTKAVL